MVQVSADVPEPIKATLATLADTYDTTEADMIRKYLTKGLNQDDLLDGVREEAKEQVLEAQKETIND